MKAKQLKRSRSLLPLGGWVSDIKVGALSLELTRETLRDPDRWPGDLAQRAAGKVGTGSHRKLNAGRGRARRRVVYLRQSGSSFSAQSPASAGAAVMLRRDEHRDFAPPPGDDKGLSLFHFTDNPAEMAA